MARLILTSPTLERPSPAAVLELLKPITWFAPMWAYGCGIVSAGEPIADRWGLAAVGVLLAGPLVCGTSQAVNDWYDRHVDAINEPSRPIPSQRVPGRWGLHIAIAWAALSLLVAATLGAWVLGGAIFGLLLAWAYSAPPTRLKRNGWWGNAAVAICYEGLAWFTGAAVMAGGLPDWRIIILAVLYSLGAHGIMTLNDFKSVEGDRRMRIRSLPVQLGVGNAAKLACVVMAVPQVVVIALLLAWGKPLHAAAIVILLTAQVVLMRRYLLDTDQLLVRPRAFAAMYNGTGTTLYVLGMLSAALGIGGILAAGG